MQEAGNDGLTELFVLSVGLEMACRHRQTFSAQVFANERKKLAYMLQSGIR